MAEMDLGTLKGSVDLDVAAFDRKYGQVNQAIDKLARQQDPSVSVDADVSGADRRLGEVQSTLQSVDGESGEVVVVGDVSRAESELGTAERALNAVDGESAEMTLDADASPAEEAIEGLGGEGEEAGEDAGEGLSKGVIAALASIPVAGAVVGIGAAIGKALLQGMEDGLNVELSRDMFSARTGLDEATAQRFGLAAGNSYASAFGESTEANLETARQALQQGLIDEDATQEQITTVVNQLTGISDVFEYDIPEAARAVGQMLKTGLVEDAEEAFDLISATSQGALSDDLMDTLTEYSGQFEQVGLDGEQAMGLIRQAMDEGARNTDKVADAVKEMGIRVREGTDPAREALDGLGLDVDGVVQRFQEGGPEAREAMQEVFDALRETREEGGNTQEAIANIFGGPGEDLGASLFALDLENVQEALGETEGKTSEVLQTIKDNAATDIAEAQNSIEQGAEGIKAALAAAFGDEISGAADWVAENRGPMMQFFKDAANAALDFAEAGIEAAADITEGFTGFVASTLPPFLEGIGKAVQAFGTLTGDTEKIAAGMGLQNAAEQARELGEGGQEAADNIRSLGGGIDDIRTKMNEEFDPQIMAAKVHDATVDMSQRLGELEQTIENTGGEVTINGETVTAEEALETLKGRINTSDGTVRVNGNKVPADQALDQLMTSVETSSGDVTISATKVPADQALEATMRAVRNSKDNVTIAGNTTPADVALDGVRAAVRASSDDVTIGGNDYPAETVLSQTLSAIRNGRENVTIDGNDYPADQTLSSLLETVGASGSSIDVGADTWTAENEINNAARDRTATIFTNAVGADAGSAAGSIVGGALDGKADGGPITGPGSGTSDDVPIAASNGEHMWTAAEVQAAGGHDAVAALRKGVLEGYQGLAVGGPVSDGQASTTVYQAPAPAAPAAPAPQPPGEMTGTLFLEDGAMLGQVRMAMRDPGVAKAASQSLQSRKDRKARSIGGTR